ncbi:MAG: glyoxalase [Rhizobiales bacterium 24-66-13]|jgi:catechol 2,3-dioxygenase-like lactoylglutathione lyase family enzyme|nr:MAG: glyoxalase [Rhizobiales bacterium 24-66-13]OZB04570.1 MAG: glyoxalase [Rhizobiales bacterium 39-66-18]
MTVPTPPASQEAAPSADRPDAAPQLRLHLVTLGVADLPRAIAFYETLGLARRDRTTQGVAFFDAGGAVLSLFPRPALAADAMLADTGAGGFSGIALAFNVASPGEVDATLAAAQAAGGTVVKAGQSVFWGGYGGYFTDPDGHLWEVAHNPFFPFDEAGHLVLPD